MTPGSVVKAIPAREGFSVDLLLGKSLALVQVFRPGDGWFAVGLLALNLMTIVWSVQRADWVATPNLAILILLGLLTSLLLSRIPIWSVLLMPVGAALGLLIVVWQITSFQAEGMQLASAAELWERLALWWSAAKGGTINIDQVRDAAVAGVIHDAVGRHALVGRTRLLADRVGEAVRRASRIWARRPGVLSTPLGAVTLARNRALRL